MSGRGHSPSRAKGFRRPVRTGKRTNTTRSERRSDVTCGNYDEHGVCGLARDHPGECEFS
jgi:hypothetical protein